MRAEDGHRLDHETGFWTRRLPPADARTRGRPHALPMTPRIAPEAAQALVNRISWIALVLTPLMSTPSDDDDEITDAVASLDALIRDVRLAAVDDEAGSDPLELARRVLDDVRAQLGACWAGRIHQTSFDPVEAGLLTEASHLLRSALISVQRGSVH